MIFYQKIFDNLRILSSILMMTY